MRAVVLVGGFGTRLRPLTLHDAQAAAAGRPPSDPRARPRPPGPRRGHRGGAVARLQARRVPRRPTPTARCAGVRLHYAVEPEPLDTAGAIRFAAATAGSSTRRFVVVNGDVLTDLDVGALVRLPPRRTAPRARCTSSRSRTRRRFGVVPTDGDGRVRGLHREAAAREDAPTNRINAGTYVLEPSVLDRIPAAGGCRSSARPSRRWWPTARCTPTPTDDYWLDAGRPDQYLQANLDLLDGVRRRRPIDPLGPGASRRSGAPSVSTASSAPAAASRAGGRSSPARCCCRAPSWRPVRWCDSVDPRSRASWWAPAPA